MYTLTASHQTDATAHAALVVLQRLLRSDMPRILIGLAGTPGSGKTFVAGQLTSDINAIAGTRVMLALSMDGFHLPKAALAALPDPALALARRGAPWTFDAAGLAARLAHIRRAAGCAPVDWPDFQHDVGDPVEAAISVPSATRIVLVEGLYLLHQADGWDAVARAFDQRWYLDTPLDLALDRLAQRHMRAWGWSRAQAAARIAENDEPNALLVAGTRTNADWILRG